MTVKQSIRATYSRVGGLVVLDPREDIRSPGMRRGCLDQKMALLLPDKLESMILLFVVRGGSACIIDQRD
jgi:hypothetical protein